MSEKLEQAEAKYDELVDAVVNFSTLIGEFRELFEPECVDFDQISEMLYNMLGEIDGQLMEENLE